MLKRTAIGPCTENLDTNNTPFIITFTVALNNMFILSSASGRVAKSIKYYPVSQKLVSCHINIVIKVFK